MAELRAQIRGIVSRELLAYRLRGRPDIIEHSALLIAAQDDPRQWENALTSLSASAIADISAADIASNLVEKTEYRSGVGAVGLPLPGGIRHPMMQWSPILQIAALFAPNRCVEGRTVEALPANVDALIAFIEISIGLRDPEWIPPKLGSRGDASNEPDDEAEDALAAMEQARIGFTARFGFSIADYAKWLFAFRASDPALYILLLSREYLIALRRSPTLGGSLDGSDVIPGLSLPPIVAAMAFGELQRVVSLYRDLVSGGRTSTSDIRAEIGDKRVSKTKRGKRMAAQMLRPGGKGEVYERAALRAEALRKRLFLLPGRNLSGLERRGLLASLFAGRADWDIEGSSENRHGAHEQIAATLAPEIYAKRVRGKGFGFHADDLNLYCGVPASYLFHLGVTELGLIFTGSVDRHASVTLADRMLEIIGGVRLTREGDHPADSAAHERLHKKAVQALPIYLPRFPNRGSAGRFNTISWLNPLRDIAIYRFLLQPVRAGDPRLAQTGKRGKLFLAIWFLQVCFPHLYRRIRERRFALRIACYLATSASVLTSDPILHSLTLRAQSLMTPKTPRRKMNDEINRRPKGFPKGIGPTVRAENIMAETARALRGERTL